MQVLRRRLCVFFPLVLTLLELMYIILQLLVNLLFIIHPLLTDPIFVHSKSFRISSSNVTAPFLELFGFGPVVGDGYGIGYLIFGDEIPMNITSFKDNAETSSPAMAASLTQALADVKEIHE